MKFNLERFELMDIFESLVKRHSPVSFRFELGESMDYRTDLDAMSEARNAMFAATRCYGFKAACYEVILDNPKHGPEKRAYELFIRKGSRSPREFFLSLRAKFDSGRVREINPEACYA